MSVAKEKYKAFQEDNYVPIFYRPFYLDAVCDAPWDVVLFEEEEQIQAVYIYMLKKKLGMKYIVQPQLCPYTGPLFFNDQSVLPYQFLVDHLPSHQLLIQDFHYNLPDLSFDETIQSTKHTWVIHSWRNVDRLWEEMSSKHRRIIKKAESELTVEGVDSIDDFLEFVERTFALRGKAVPHDPIVFKKLDKALISGNHRKIVKCTNSENVVVAMGYFIMDEQWTYNFANSVIDDYRHYGMNLILWNEIKLTLSKAKSFDFEGSMIPGVNELFQRFKGEKKTYSSRYKSRSFVTDFLVRLKGIKPSG